ncbi:MULTISPECIES: alpha/beta hydrolase [unclassified Microbacterium]|uniref:alpha/beta hydrolase n=1 Tax=unclassified Microbacterium TaxID=2609290 RepID=UPI0016573B37|nr:MULTISPECIES: alpha/beta fold hydrolase [unclassified Microbacterium]MCT1365433.1 alpha/beta fold hydrolase [Microbacterium sp. p3-SID131]MCT1378037.1 alpha/beta fold hydrolase [Microbacterium sp. p3-SID337]MDH5132056.1 alpha/beta fold hydrolase [Microbacterium sp. RD10]MDH5135997.1 alpha/beta fold hydrolase [Microbacterium sp. RD11]MDH5144082.1 alpha/beta fold hydrolase [Microbacterium sp. RD12]
MTENLTIDAAATRWSPPDPAGLPLLVLLHGYGADEHDLFGLVPYLPSGIAVASVAAPLAPPWPTPGRSWYPIEGLDGRSSAAVTLAAEAFLRWLDEAAADAPSVALLGFSQGAAVSLQALRLAPERFGAVVALSGYAAPDALPQDEHLAEVSPPVFWGRGTHDDVIPAPLIAHTAQWLPAHTTLSGRVYSGLTHSISEEELGDVHRFLTTWVAGIDADQAEGPRPS